jgi:putative phosphoribosyl transferase
MQAKQAISGEVNIQLPSVTLYGDLIVPADATGIVLFAHGSGSSRHSPRNKFVAQTIRNASLGTLLFDLLTQDEEAIDIQTRHLRFDIAMLAERLFETAKWVLSRKETKGLRAGFFGASTGGGAALVAAAKLGIEAGAVVSRGGRPDLAGEALARVTAPTLLIVGEYDDVVIQLNREAFDRLNCEKRMDIVPKATHLFEEPGALEEVARLASDWFVEHLQ